MYDSISLIKGIHLKFLHENISIKIDAFKMQIIMFLLDNCCSESRPSFLVHRVPNVAWSIPLDHTCFWIESVKINTIVGEDY